MFSLGWPVYRPPPPPLRFFLKGGGAVQAILGLFGGCFSGGEFPIFGRVETRHRDCVVPSSEIQRQMVSCGDLNRRKKNWREKLFFPPV